MEDRCTAEERLAALIAGSGYVPQDAVIVGMHRREGEPVFVSQGVTGAGEWLSSGTIVYAASLSKQVTAACAAILVREGKLNMEDTLAKWMPELPSWAAIVRLRHLVYHTSGLPDPDADAVLGGTTDWTSLLALAGLSQSSNLVSRPGTIYRYSGIGYTCLAAVVERAAGQPLPSFADNRIFGPLAMRSTRF